MYIRSQIWMLQVRENEILLRNSSGGSAHLRTLEGTLATRELARFDNDSKPKSQVNLFKFPEENYNFLKTYRWKHSFIFPMSEWERMFFAKRQLQTKWKNTEISLRLPEKFQARFDHFQESKPCFAFLANPFNVNVSVMAVQFANRLLQTCLL